MSLLLPAFAFNGGPVQANPSGGVVVHGAADFANVAANQLMINQTSQNVIINWQDFSIAAGEITRFAQPTGGAALNRVVSGNVSQIYGTLQGNANVYVINPNGIFIGASGVIDIGGRAVISTLDIDNNDFLDGGDARFYGDSTTGVTNFGTISSSGGDVVLMGGFVDNHGQIGALNGTVAIGSGGDILLQEGAGAKISVRGASDYTGTGIDNQGTIQGASAELKAHGNVYALAINNGGAIRANGADRSNGRVRLTASGGSSNINLGNSSVLSARVGSEGGTVEVESAGMVELGGSIDVAGTKGGEASVVGRDVTQLQGSKIDAGGSVEGGQIKIEAAQTLRMSGAAVADGGTGAGGQVDVTGRAVLIKDDVRISADGGTTGGKLRIGGDFQGQDSDIREADWVYVDSSVKLSANSLDGDAGTVIVWSNGDTMFMGEVSASARGAVGNGGLIEISGSKYLYYDGSALATSKGGQAGTVLFDPIDVVIGSAGAGPVSGPVSQSLISVASINRSLEAGMNVLVYTPDGSITFENLGGGGDARSTTGNQRDIAVQWTNSNGNFGAFAAKSIFVNNHIRTSGGGSISLLAGWDPSIQGIGAVLGMSPQDAWDDIVSRGEFGRNGGSIFVGNPSIVRHVEVGSRFGDTNLAAGNVFVLGSDSDSSYNGYAQIGFRDSGNVFAPPLSYSIWDPVLGANVTISLDLTKADGYWYLSDGKSATASQNQVSGVGDPIVGVAGNAYGQEVDLNHDGIPDGVYGINSSGLLTDTFIPYANHYNSATTGNWWWQQISAASIRDALAADPAADLSAYDLGALRPENGAGIVDKLADGSLDFVKGANINVIATGSVTVQAGAGRDMVAAQIGHGGVNLSAWGSTGTSYRDIGNETAPYWNGTTFANNTAFSVSNAESVQTGQIERRWSVNGTRSERTGTSIARLAPVYGNINVLAGVKASDGVQVDRAAGTVSATVGDSGSVIVRAAQAFETANVSSNSAAAIGHGGLGQFGEFYGDIHVEAGGNVTLQAGNGTRSAAVIGHYNTGYAEWNVTSAADQQIRFFAATGDFDNTNLRRGELFSGRVTTGFDPNLDPMKNMRYSTATAWVVGTGTDGQPMAVVAPGATGNYVPVIDMVGGVAVPRVDEFGNPIFRNANRTTVNFDLAIAQSTASNNKGIFIYFHPSQYSRGVSGVADHSQGRSSFAPLDLAPNGPITVAALDGSVISGFHGNITVKAGGDITLTGYETANVNGYQPRDSRFASIGHGGRNFGYNADGAGYVKAAVPVAYASGGLNYEYYRILTGNELNTGSSSYFGESGTAFDRALTFMTITGDIDVSAGGNLTMTAGNDQYDVAVIGHGGSYLSDYETSSLVLGDIRVRAGGDILVRGGGFVQPKNRYNTDQTVGTTDGTNNYDLLAWAQIGHQGLRSGFMGYMGDIDVEAGGSIHLQAGAFSRTEAKIGHDTTEGRAQSGGDFIRTEHFLHDSVGTYINTVLGASIARVAYSPDSNNHSSALNAVRDFSDPSKRFGSAGTLVGGDKNTADIRVVAGGDILMDHLPIGLRQPEERLIYLMGANYETNPRFGTHFNVNDEGQGIRTRNTYAQIGHGAIQSTSANANNTSTNYGDRVGDIYVEAGGDLIMKNSRGDQRWTRIGHGVGAGTRVDDGTNVGYSRAIEMAGDIVVKVGGDILIDASAAEENDRAENGNAANGATNASRWNPVVIGHGGVIDNLDVVVLGSGEVVNGIAASSNIEVTAGGNISILGGNGTEASYAQVGHGYASNDGQELSRRMGVQTGFTGDIKVTAAGDINIIGGANAWIMEPSSTSGAGGSLTTIGRSVHGAFAAIGHGGYMLDAPAMGDISVYAGGSLNIKGQERTDETTDTAGTVGYILVNSTPGLTDVVASAFNFAKIGHFSAYNGTVIAGTGSQVRDVNQVGDITVVVAGDLTMKGGQTPNVDLQTIYGAFVQIGHGGPSVSGNLEGDITVLVKGDILVERGSEIRPGVDQSLRAMNNYAQIGHGDFVNDKGGVDYLFGESAGARYGDIEIAAGRSATFDGSLVGHVDPALANPIRITNGDLIVAVSRLNPFYGGGGDLIAHNGAIFASGGSGFGTMAQFFMPARSNNKMDNTTRINESIDGFTEAPNDFAAPFNGANGKLAGRADEVYLTPDLWWDDAGRAAAQGWTGSGIFPGDAETGVGGAIAQVDSPGGLQNLSALAAGELGSSATPYRDANGVSGGGFYTLYYDAIQPVANIVPTPPVAPGPPVPPIVYPQFDFSGYFFDETYDPFFRDWDLWNEIGGDGSELYPLLGLFERDSDTQEENGAWKLENRLDDMFGPRRDSTTQEEDDEDEISRRKRAKKGGPVAMTFYVYEPGTNRYSSYRVFGNRITSFYPGN